jgi:hypothetical protein
MFPNLLIRGSHISHKLFGMALVQISHGRRKHYDVAWRQRVPQNELLHRALFHIKSCSRFGFRSHFINIVIFIARNLQMMQVLPFPNHRTIVSCGFLSNRCFQLHLRRQKKVTIQRLHFYSLITAGVLNNLKKTLSNWRSHLVNALAATIIGNNPQHVSQLPHRHFFLRIAKPLQFQYN